MFWCIPHPLSSITASDIALAVEQATGEEIDKRQIVLDQPIRELGTHQVPVRLMAEVVPEVTVIVEREGAEIETGEYDESAEQAAAFDERKEAEVEPES